MAFHWEDQRNVGVPDPRIGTARVPGPARDAGSTSVVN